jgi:hypothetical protein
VKLIIYIEHEDGSLSPVGKTDVPDTSAKPEADAWRAFQRSNTLGDATYRVQRAGERFRLRSTQQQVSESLGAAS